MSAEGQQALEISFCWFEYKPFQSCFLLILSVSVLLNLFNVMHKQVDFNLYQMLLDLSILDQLKSSKL